MNKWIEKGIRILYQVLEKQIKNFDKPTSENVQNPPYHSLSPINNANVSEYIVALNWALNNTKKEDIYNIALTGPYGSGKSSILKTFQNQNTNIKNQFLEISLATFKEETREIGLHKSQPEPNPAELDNLEIQEPPTANGSKKNEELLRLIELSILQQIFYHEEDSKIPDSRFKKIKSFKRNTMVLVTAGILTALLFGFNFFYPDKIQSLLKLDLPALATGILRWTSFIIFLISLYIVIFRSIRLLYGLQVSKFKINEAEIEIDKNISKSILNNHLDEILYFFEVTKYSVVLIEDLDRFRQSEIFTKLRELNLLINKSKKVKQDVVFIYAVRDEIFKDKERTKFFDFIIPVIPVINASNSNETLSSIVAKNNYLVGNDLIEDISLFIDDMRLLYNITNEYHLYHQLLDKELDQNKLLAIIVYKNIYPEDFVKLGDESGKLFKLINERKNYVKKALTTIDQKIAVKKIEIDNIENHVIKDEIELRMIYLAAYVNEIKGFNGFIINGTNQSLKAIANDQDLFDYLINDDVSYSQYYTSYSSNYLHQPATEIKFSNVEAKVDSNNTFDDRLGLIGSNFDDTLEQLKRDIQVLEKEKIKIRHSKIKTLLSDRSLNLDIDSKTKQGQLFSVLLKSGYIDEDYLDYISLFYEGSLTKEDRSFLLNVKGQTALDYDFRLNKIDNLIGKIRIVDFQENYILNYSLVDHLLIHEGYDEQLNALLGQLNNSNNYGANFIDGFLSNGVNIEPFIEKIVAKWTGILKYIDSASDYTKERKEDYLKLILHYSTIEDIKKVSKESKLIETINDSENFLSFLEDDNRTEEVIQALDIRFNKLDFDKGSKELADFVYQKSFYQINQQMIEKVMQYSGKFNRSEFETANYASIQNSESTFLISYIDKNIDQYVQKIYLTLPDNKREPQDTLLLLLNNESIKLENRIKIIREVETKVLHISSLLVEGIAEPLLKYNKLEATWDNLTIYFDHNERVFSPELVSFLNNAGNVETLSDEEIDPSKIEVDAETSNAFIIALLNETGISDSNYELLLEAISEVYDISNFTNLSFEKMELLVDSLTVGTDATTFEVLKTDYPNLQHSLLEGTPENFIENISDYAIDSDDLLYVLNSQKYSADQKHTIISEVDETLITKNVKALKVTIKLIFENSTFVVPKTVLLAALTADINTEDRVKLFNMHYQLFSKSEIPMIFGTFPYPYSDIGILHKSPVIPFGTENAYLANNLQSKRWIANTKEDKRGIRIINFKK